MTEVYRCSVVDCKYNKDGECNADYIDIDEVLTASGFHPMCTTYEEGDNCDRQ